ncbi:hypothetical protein PR202_gb18783 [Eleusine coracana subsp. coracana]|uniref:Uncharacterized protein n=1 Tax=Eleusine coracana subsp. coracana TaxID=191504 RepID=A0AAV5F4B0_ELECO|nr:hypothetical protein PR202_gb18783 [Eleusine coracana subsp. coracana]
MLCLVAPRRSTEAVHLPNLRGLTELSMPSVQSSTVGESCSSRMCWTLVLMVKSMTSLPVTTVPYGNEIVQMPTLWHQGKCDASYA